MREEIAAARDLEAEVRAESVAVDRDEEEIAGSRKMPGGGFGRLRRGREVDEAVLVVDRRAFEDALRLRIAPERGRAYLVNQRHGWHERGLRGRLIGGKRWGQPREPRRKFR